MLRNYLTIAIRHLTRHKLFSLINIFCLAIGITFSLMIGTYVLSEIRVNTDLKDLANQYVIRSNWTQDNMGSPSTSLGPLARTMKEEYPGLVKNYYRFDPVVNIVSFGDKHFRVPVSAGDTSLVSMYGFPLLYGNPRQAFRNNESAVVTEEFARKFFNRTDVVDQTISIQTPADGMDHHFVISAVLKKMPANSVNSFTRNPYQVYLPMDANQYFQGGDKGDNWSNVFLVNMVELNKGVSPRDLEKPIARILEKYQPSFVKGNLKIELIPMRSYYLQDNNHSVQTMITLLSLIAIFILLLAIFNFININIGSSAYRLKEIGLRKVFGGVKTQLIIQYMTEALVLTSMAALISLVCYEILLPVFNGLLHTTLAHFWEWDLSQIFFLMVLVAVVGISAGIYPAFILSSTNTIRSVRGQLDSVQHGLATRKLLLVIQFTLAIVVFISAINISRQVAYFFNKDLGYQKEQILIVSSLPRQWDSAGVIRMENAKASLLKIPGVEHVSLSYDIPDGNAGGSLNVYVPNKSGYTSMMSIATDDDFAKVFGLQTESGIFLQENKGAYGQGRVVLNETAQKVLGLQQAIGTTIRLGAADGIPLSIVGVIKDFHFESLQKPVQPMLIAGLNEPFTRAYRYYSIKLNTPAIHEAVQAVEAECRTLFPEAGFEYGFMDEKFQSLYQSELQLKEAADLATVLNLIIVFLGVFGVLTISLARRTREMAIRKVLGANAKNIVFIFIKEYGWILLLSNAIAWPLAYHLTNKWLENYAFRIQQNALPYVLAGLCIMITAFALIALQCLKTAGMNPVKSLKAE